MVDLVLEKHRVLVITRMVEAVSFCYCFVSLEKTQWQVSVGLVST